MFLVTARIAPWETCKEVSGLVPSCRFKSSGLSNTAVADQGFTATSDRSVCALSGTAPLGGDTAARAECAREVWIQYLGPTWQGWQGYALC